MEDRESREGAEVTEAKNWAGLARGAFVNQDSGSLTVQK